MITIEKKNNKRGLSKKNIISFLRTLFLSYGKNIYLGEEVSVSEHMLQTAACVESSGGDRFEIVGALLHDIGHLLHDMDKDSAKNNIDTRHESMGANLLEKFFPNKVADIVRYHVDAKRYLCSIDESYYNILSDASKESLGLQGNKMSKEEIKQFESNPNKDSILFVRKCEEKGKIPNLKVKQFGEYEDLINKVLADK